MAALLGCSSSDERSSKSGSPDDGPKRPTNEAAADTRAACGFEAGSLPRDTLGESDPIGDAIPIEHVLLLMMENRSFDHYFAKLPEQGQPDVDVVDDGFRNVDATGQEVAPFHESRHCIEDPAHGWNSTHRQYGDGALDGFVMTNEPDGARALGYYDATDLPFYYELASTFAIGDRYFSSLLGPTWPNRLYFLSGSSHGLTENSIPVVAVPNIFSALNEAGIEWTEYRSNLAPAAMFIETWISSTSGCGRDNGEPCRVADLDDFFDDVARGELPPVTFLEPEYSTGIHETSEHPPGNMQLGQELVWRVVDALMRSPLWEKSALFITYDEHGGFFDHVPPPPACDPGTGDPDDPSLGVFDRYGFRVPFFVVSPFAKKHHVSHETYDHTSVLRFVQAKFGLAAFSKRDANADAMMDLFDFEAAPHAIPPTFERPPVEPEGLAQCEMDFPGGS